MNDAPEHPSCRRSAGVLALGVGLALLPGCPNPNTYATPRTIAPGKVAHSIAAESWAIAKNAKSDSYAVPLVPTYAARIGLAERVDVGVRMANGWALGSDVKFLLAKGSVDVALDPGFQFFGYPGSRNNSSSSSRSSSSNDGAVIFYGHLPVLVGVNAADWLTIVGTAGATFGAMGGFNDGGSDITDVMFQRGVMGRLGGGLDIRFDKRFAIHPELTMLRNFKQEQTTLMGGLGINWGALPTFD
jgi:hypothetical protein